MGVFKTIKENVEPLLTKTILKTVAWVVLSIAGLLLYTYVLPSAITEPINEVAWVVSNLALAYTCVVLVVFIVAYVIIFDPRATTGGQLIFRFMLSLVGVIVLSYIGVFVDPAPDRSWFLYPGEDLVETWRPITRLVVYVFVAFSITALSRLLILRKWFPHKVKKAGDLVLIKPRHTSEIQIVKDLNRAADE